MPSARPLGTRNRAFPALTSATVRLTLCTKCATPYPAIVRTLRKIFRRKRHFLPIFSATRTLPSCSVLSTNPDSSSCCRTTRLPCRFSRLYCSQVCGANRHWKASRISLWFSRYRTRKRFRFVKTSKITFTLLIYCVRLLHRSSVRSLYGSKTVSLRCTTPLRAGGSFCSSRSETHRASC